MGDLSRLDEQTELLLRTARGLDDLAAPSLCAGWTRGHVLAHLARNADALTRVAVAVRDGVPTSMYDSVESRDAEIEAGSRRTAADAVADLASSAAVVRGALAHLGPEHGDVPVPRLAGGPPVFVAGRLPAMRLREVVYHHVDLDAGFGFADLDSDLAVELLGDQVTRLAEHPDAPSLRIRTDEGDTWVVGEGGPLVSGTRAGVLLWLSRQVPDGVRASEGALPGLPSGG